MASCRQALRRAVEPSRPTPSPPLAQPVAIAAPAARLDDDVMEMLYGEDGPTPEILGPRTEALKGCLGKLAPMAGDLIRRRYHLGQMPEAIAAAVGWTPNSVRVALTRARQTLRACVDRSLGTSELS